MLLRRLSKVANAIYLRKSFINRFLSNSGVSNLELEAFAGNIDSMAKLGIKLVEVSSDQANELLIKTDEYFKGVNDFKDFREFEIYRGKNNFYDIIEVQENSLLEHVRSLEDALKEQKQFRMDNLSS